MRTTITAPLVLGVVLFASPAQAQSFALQVDAPASSVSLNSAFGIELPGSLIGDYDPVDNPGGTRTLPGLFGGTGNQPVSAELGFAGVTGHVGSPQGSLVLEADATLLVVELRELELDLLGGGRASTDLTLSLLFDTFRTFAPNSLFIGGFPISLPLGSQTVSNLLLVQNGPSAVGTLTPTAEAGRYTFALIVPAALSFTMDFGGQAFPVGPLPALLPLTGELWIANEAAVVEIDFDFDIDEQIVDPLPGFTIDDVPLPLPTILPPGSTANLLFSAVVGSIDVSAAATLSLRATGEAPCGFETYCTSNPNSTGQVAELQVSGSANVADAELEFTVSGLPAGKVGFLVLSQGETYTTTYRGNQGGLCLTAPFIRLGQTTMIASPAGTASTALDFGALPNGLTFMPGSTWRFQYWYRDQNPAPTWNSSNAVRTRFCDAP